MHQRTASPEFIVAGVIVVTVSLLVSAQEPADTTKTQGTLQNIRLLDWLAGVWRGTFEKGEWEASYSTPHAGVILGSSKEIIGGRVNMIEFEHFRVELERIVLTPYPFGTKAPVDFTLRQLNTTPNSERAVFSNPEHDFPQQLVYERKGADQLHITITGNINGQPTTSILELKRVRD